MKAYVEFEITEGAYEISCPDALCPSQGVLAVEDEIAKLVSGSLLEKHQRYRLNRGNFTFICPIVYQLSMTMNYRWDQTHHLLQSMFRMPLAMIEIHRELLHINFTIKFKQPLRPCQSIDMPTINLILFWHIICGWCKINNNKKNEWIC